MKPEMQAKKKYAVKTYTIGRSSRVSVKREREVRGAGFVEITSGENLPEITPEEKAADQQRRQAILAGLLARAQTLTPDPEDSPTRKACRESPIMESIAEKFRRQGFNV